jgi:hypothetical protein
MILWMKFFILQLKRIVESQPVSSLIVHPLAPATRLLYVAPPENPWHFPSRAYPHHTDEHQTTEQQWFLPVPDGVGAS